MSAPTPGELDIEDRAIALGSAVPSHTPGPWEIREVAHAASPYGPRRVYRVEIARPILLPNGNRLGSRHVCQIIDYADWTDHPANASLIAAAPELLAALKAIERHNDNPARYDSHINTLCETAIAKAENAAAQSSKSETQSSGPTNTPVNRER